MKKMLLIFSTGLVLLFAACRKNQCYNQYCLNGGYCENGGCQCPPGVTGPHCDSNHLGYVTFWASSNCNCGPISVTCNGYTAHMTEYFPTDTPACGAQGCANFSLAPGTYNYTASCTDSSWSGSVTVSTGNCTRQQLGCITGNVTFWFDSVQNTATVKIGGNTGKITSVYTSTTPTCGASGCANFMLPVGTYTYTATSSSNSWSGNVVITANGCQLVLL
jgi:major membrane immunogen (membrane-anchored lipoprotein)